VPDIEHYENLVLGSGESGKYTAWALAKAGEHTGRGRTRTDRRLLPQYRLPAQQEHHS
jgi:hypothetical protein